MIQVRHNIDTATKEIKTVKLTHFFQGRKKINTLTDIEFLATEQPSV